MTVPTRGTLVRVGAERKQNSDYPAKETLVSTLTATDWLYVVVQNPETDSQIVGQHDEALDVHFIPAFTSKEDAQQGLLQLPTSRGAKYEVQAIILEDLHRYASDKAYMLFVLDADGRIKEQIAPLA